MASGATAQRRAREKRERREAILDAAERVFGEKGAHASTMEDVADTAAVSKGTVYLYFKSKDDLVVALTHRPLDAVLARFAQLTDDPSVDGLTLLRSLLETHAEVLHAHAPHFRLAMSSMCGGSDAGGIGEPDPLATSLGDYRERIRSIRRTYIETLERGVRDGSMRPHLDPTEVAAALWAAMFGASFLRMNASRFRAHMPDDPHPVDFDRTVSLLTDMLLDAVRARTGDA
jgi:AcrR family transcriptional regulator